MDDCGAILHNIETKWLYDFLTLEKCRNFSQAAVSRNVSQPAFSRRIRALEQAIGVELFNRQVTPLQLSEQGKIFHSQIRHLLQQLESNLAELRGGSDYAQRKIGNDSNLLIVFYVQIMPDDFVMQLHRF